MPMRLADYGPGWREVSRRIRFERAQNRCEWCGAENGKPHPITGSRVVLTVAHMPDSLGKTDHRPEVLAALCQKCHLGLDRPHHLRKAAETRARKRGQLALGLEEGLPNMADYYLSLPRLCLVCSVPLDPEAVALGNDGSVLCPEHIGTVA